MFREKCFIKSIIKMKVTMLPNKKNIFQFIALEIFFLHVLNLNILMGLFLVLKKTRYIFYFIK